MKTILLKWVKELVFLEVLVGPTNNFIMLVAGIFAEYQDIIYVNDTKDIKFLS